MQFLLSAGVIAVSGIWLSCYGDVIAERRQLGGTWVGVLLVAPVTSLPELVNGISLVTLAKAPYIALGDGLGSCVFNLLPIALLDFSYRETAIFLKASQGPHLWQVSQSCSSASSHSSLSGDPATLRVGHVGLYTPAIIVLYIVAV